MNDKIGYVEKCARPDKNENTHAETPTQTTMVHGDDDESTTVTATTTVTDMMMTTTTATEMMTTTVTVMMTMRTQIP